VRKRDAFRRLHCLFQGERSNRGHQLPEENVLVSVARVVVVNRLGKGVCFLSFLGCHVGTNSTMCDFNCVLLFPAKNKNKKLRFIV
jgi:hypothetical protein